MGERVLTVGGNTASRPVEDFMVNVSTEFFVCSVTGDDGRSGRSKATCYETLDAIISKCTASKNDIIYVLPGHAETLSTAAAINLDVIGVRVIGLGEGALRPTFTFSAVDATITMTAASCSIENCIIVPSIDSVVSPIVVSAANCKVDVEVRDASATVECVSAILTTAAADNLDINLKYRGFLAGDACVSPIKLVGVDTARINVDFYGVASTAIVEFHTTDCHDIDITGLFYNDGTSLTKNVVDTVTGSTWSARGWDGNSNANFSGGDNAALASDDSGAIAAAVAVIDGYHDVATADAVTNAVMSDVVGNKEDAAAAGAVSTTETLMAYAKQNVTAAIAAAAALVTLDEFQDVPAADNVLNAQINEVIGNKTDAAAAGAVTATDTLVGYIKQIVTSEIANTAAIGVVDGFHDVPGADVVTNTTVRDVVGNKTDAAAAGAVSAVESLMAYAKQNVTANIAIVDMQEKSVSGSTAVMVNADTIFTIAGGPIEILSLVSVCITLNDGTASTLQYSADPTVGAATTFSGASASLANAAAGSGAVLNMTALDTAVDLIDPLVGLTAVHTRGVIVNAGIITVVIGIGSTTGTWKHYLRYRPLSTGVTVTGA